MNKFLLFAEYYLLGFLFLTIFFGLGYSSVKLISRRFELSRHKAIFFSLFLGSIIAIVVFSVIVTKFRTINLGFLLIIAILIFQTRGLPVINGLPLQKGFLTMKKIGVFALVFFVFYTWEAIFLFKGGTFPFALPHNDFIFSSNISSSLLRTGYENFFMEGNLYNPSYHYMIPYHYFEIWMNSFIVYFTGANDLLSLMLCVFPTFYFIAWLGIVSIFEHFIMKISWKEYVLSFLLLFLGGLIVYLKQSDFFFNMHALAPVPMELATKKYAPFYVFILAVLLLLLERKILPAILVLLSLSFVSITAFPAIFAGLILVILINAFLKLVDRRIVFRLLGYMSMVSIFIVLVYFYFNRSPFGLVFTDQNTSIISKLLSPAYVKTFAHVMGGGAIQTLILYSPFLILGLLIVKKTGIKDWAQEQKVVMLAFLSIVISGLFIWAVLWDMSNATGFFASSLCYLNVLLIFLFVFYYKKVSSAFYHGKNILLVGFVLLLFCRFGLAFYYNWDKKNKQATLYSDEYINKVENQTKNKNLNPFGVSMMAYDKYNNLFSRNTYFIRLGQYLKFLPHVKLTTNINIVNAPLPVDSVLQKQETGLIQLSVFYQFVEDQKKNNQFVSIDQSQVDFIDKYHIDYVIADKGVSLSPLLQKRLDKEIEDPVSGERFILLN